ncbi:equilibrative nucleotide transporter 3-like protein [Tanacetum coccineum]
MDGVFHLIFRCGEVGRTYNRSFGTFLDEIPVNNSRHVGKYGTINPSKESVGVSEFVTSIFRNVKDAGDVFSVDYSIDFGSWFLDMWGTLVLVEFDSMDQVESSSTSKALVVAIGIIGSQVYKKLVVGGEACVNIVAMISIFGKKLEVDEMEGLKHLYLCIEKGYNSMPLDLPGTPFKKAMKAHDEARYSKRLSKKQLFFENYDYAMDLFLIYVVTLSIFPGFLYENTGSHQLGTWYPLVLVTTYNVSNLAVRYVPLIKVLKMESRKGITVLVLSRFVFIPLFYFTSKYGDQGWMIVLVIFLGVTTGYPAMSIMTVAPQSCTGPDRYALGNMLVLSLQIGGVIGIGIDWLWIIGNGSF